jgi:uncharacterized membrane protein YhaH (DUF805 family)
VGWYIAVLKKYAVFDGRARRKEYWMFFLFSMIVSFALGFIGGLIGGPGKLLGMLYSLGTLVPSIAVGVRRMHDTDHSGGWLLAPILNIVLLCSAGTSGPNRFGADPKASS